MLISQFLFHEENSVQSPEGGERVEDSYKEYEKV